MTGGYCARPAGSFSIFRGAEHPRCALSSNSVIRLRFHPRKKVFVGSCVARQNTQWRQRAGWGWLARDKGSGLLRGNDASQAQISLAGSAGCGSDYGSGGNRAGGAGGAAGRARERAARGAGNASPVSRIEGRPAAGAGLARFSPERGRSSFSLLCTPPGGRNETGASPLPRARSPARRSGQQRRTPPAA